MPLYDKSFRSFVSAQLLGAFNDNLFKQLVLLLAANKRFPGKDMQGLAFAIFSLPFILFSGIAGDISEKYPKRRIMVLMKWAEIGIMLAGAIALQVKSAPFLGIVLFVMGVQSAFFGPSKYGGLPELVHPNNLIRANGAVTMTTFLAVLLGSGLAGPLIDGFGDDLWVTGIVCIAIAGIGTWAAHGIRHVPAQKPDHPLPRQPFGNLLTTIRQLKKQDGLMGLVVLNSVFWFNSAVINQGIIGLGGEAYLGIGEGEQTKLTLVLATVSASIGLGAFLAPGLSKRFGPGNTALGGAVVMFASQLCFNLVGPVISRAEGGLTLMHAVGAVTGIAGACLAIPITAFLQHAPQEGMKGMTFGVTNFMNFLFMFLSGVYYLGVPVLGVSPALAMTGSGAIMLVILAFNLKRLKAMSF